MLSKKQFSKAEFENLFLRATQRCYQVALESCQGPLPPGWLFYLPDLDRREEFDEALIVKCVPASCLKSFEKTIPFLVNEEGFFQAWINISPDGITNQETVFEICIPNRWTDNMISGELAFPYEPFHILSPTLPTDWNKEPQLTTIKLPFIKTMVEK